MKLQLDADDLRPLVRLVVQEVLAEVEADHAKLDGGLGYSEPEAAALLGIQRHALRDCRLRGEVRASKIGKRIVYPREALLSLLANNQVGG